jgi:hypothetical protein
LPIVMAASRIRSKSLRSHCPLSRGETRGLE